MPLRLLCLLSYPCSGLGKPVLTQTLQCLEKLFAKQRSTLTQSLPKQSQTSRRVLAGDERQLVAVSGLALCCGSRLAGQQGVERPLRSAVLSPRRVLILIPATFLVLALGCFTLVVSLGLSCHVTTK